MYTQTKVPRWFFFCWSFMFFLSCVLLCLCACLLICALWLPAGKGLTSWLLFVVSNCEFVTYPLVSWVRCGTWLYWFLIFAPLLTFLDLVLIPYVSNQRSYNSTHLDNLTRAITTCIHKTVKWCRLKPKFRPVLPLRSCSCLTLCLLGYFCMLFCLLLIFCQNHFF